MFSCDTDVLLLAQITVASIMHYVCAGLQCLTDHSVTSNCRLPA